MPRDFPDLKDQEEIDKEYQIQWDIIAVWIGAFLLAVAFWSGVFKLIAWMVLS